MKNVRFFPLCQHVNKQLCSCIIITALTIVSSPLQANTFLLESVRETEVLNSVTQQKVKVTGRVVDSTGEPLPGAAVVIQGTPQGVTTDMDGNFSMEVDLNAKLEISYLGMEKEVLTASELQKNKVVQLKDQTDELEEVTVVAFAKQKKESVLASVSTIKPAELKAPTSNLTTALAGRVAGMISYQRSGEPGMDNADFFIRGVTTFGYSKSPLILMDGLEISSSDLSRLQPDDIASFSIMKDATATALYGARGANGVILVTTKEGKEGKAKIEFRIENSIQTPTRKVELADPITYMRLHNEAVKTRNPLGALPYTQEKIANTIAGANPYMYPATDWYALILNDAVANQRYNLNLSGGGTVARYYIAATFNQDHGLMKVDKRNNFNNNIDLKRYAIRSNVNINVTKKTKVNVRLYTTIEDYTGPIDGGTTLYNKIMQTSPVGFPAFYPQTKDTEHIQHIMFGNTYATESEFYINPYADMVKGYRDQSSSMILAQFELSQDLDFITKGLKARALFSTTRNSSFDVSRYYNPFYYLASNYNSLDDTYKLTELNPEGGTEYLGYNEGTKNISTNTYVEAAVSYDRTFKEKHAISGMLIYTLRNELHANASSLQLSLPYRNMGLSGRFTYAYNDRYFLEANFGYNGSERFAQKERFGFFPSVGLGYIVSNENFYRGPIAKIIPKLKLKATYGLVGNDAIGNNEDRFFYLSEVNMNNTDYSYRFGTDYNVSKNGISVSRYANPYITWEVSKKLNVGTEFNLLNAFDVQIDYFQDKRSNILQTRAAIPETMGVQAAVRANVGEAESSGFDMSVDYNYSFNKNFWMQGRFNFTYATSKITKYEEVDYSNTPWRSKVGHSINQQWGYVAERLFVDEQDIANSPKQFGDYLAGDIKYKDINNDGVITEADQVPIGFPTDPEIVYGFGLSAGYKGFDISCFFQGLARESFWLNVGSKTGTTHPFIDNDLSGHGQNQLLKIYADDHWSETNRNIYALWPRLSETLVSNNNRTSTWFMQDGSFLRLKSVEVGYSFPHKWIKKAFLSKLRIYYSGTNLLTFSKFDLWDPEMAGNGLGYPIQRVHNIGIQVGF